MLELLIADATGGDSTARLILADYLEERGNPKAALIRAIVPFAGEAPINDGPDWQSFAACCHTVYSTVNLNSLIEKLDGPDKIRFSCDCAEWSMRLTKWTDQRSWNATAVARKYADGKTTLKKLNAAQDAAWAATHAAQDAAWAATHAAWATARADRTAWDFDQAAWVADRAARAADQAAWVADPADRFAAWDAARRRFTVFAVERLLGIST